MDKRVISQKNTLYIKINFTLMTQKFMAVLRRGVAIVTILSLFAFLIQSAGAADIVTVQTAVQTAISQSVDTSSKDLGALTPGDPNEGTTTTQVTTNAAGGFTVGAAFTGGSYTDTLRHTDGTTYITDKTDFTGIGGCPANTDVWSGTGFGFTVWGATANKSTTCWGTGTAQLDAFNEYAGFPTTTTTIHTVTSGPVAGSFTSIGYKVDVPTTQKSGTYSGPVTYTATATP